MWKCASAAAAMILGLQAASAAVAQAPAGDALAGAKLFDTRCKTCHTATPDLKNGLGPALYGVVGRRAAALPGFTYSPALTKSGLTWTVATLDPWLAAPAKAVPGSKMFMPPIADAKIRADLIAYLRGQAPAPAPTRKAPVRK